MAAYLLFIRESPVHDEAAFREYQQGNRAAGPAPGVKPLVAYGAIEALEGEMPDGVVLLEFPDAQAARDWYAEPGYQERAKLRHKAADYRAMLIEGFDPNPV